MVMLSGISDPGSSVSWVTVRAYSGKDLVSSGTRKTTAFG